MKTQLERLKLDDGWSASVVTALEGMTDASVPPLPTVERWRSLLVRLIRDPAGMPAYERLKYSRKGEVFRVQLEWDGGTLDVVCKQARVRGAAKRFLASWRPTTERTGFHRGMTLLKAGINTALPLAVLERGPARREAMLITRFLPDAVDLDQVALILLPQLDPCRQRRVKNALIEAIVGLLQRMRRHGLGHRDLKATNVLLTDWNSQDRPVRPWLIDLEGLRTRTATSDRRQWQPLIRLAASLLERPAVTRTDYCRFLKAYLERTGIGSQGWKSRYRALAVQAESYVRRYRRRRTAKHYE